MSNISKKTPQSDDGLRSVFHGEAPLRGPQKNKWKKGFKGLLAGMLLLACLAGAGFTKSEKAEAATGPITGILEQGIFKDTAGHWASGTIAWGVSLQIVNGYEDGGFHPDQKVTSAEFLAMLLRAFPVANVSYAESLIPWYGTYFNYAAGQNWPVEPVLANEPYPRGDVARLIAATQGQQLGMDDAVQYLLTQRLAEGKTSATVEGFGKLDVLTRAEALQFIHNLVDKKVSLRKAPPAPKKQDPVAVRGVVIGDFESTVISKLGQPQRKDKSEYAFQWYIYNSDYNNYAQIGIQDGQVVALFSNAATWSTDTGLQNGSAKSSLTAAYGSPLRFILKGSTQYNLSNTEEAPTYELDGNYMTFFLDLHQDSQLSAIQVIRKDAELSKAGFYGTSSDELRVAYERELLDMANVSRVKLGKRAFTWDEKIAGTARKHSKDMADNDYFAHVNLNGKDPFARMRDDQVLYSKAAENIAAGQTSAIFAHASWMNSFTGHREAILGDTLRLGVGVYFGGSMSVYYTENFYTPR